MTELFLDTFDSELGKILLVTNGKALCALDFVDYESRMTKLLQKRYGETWLMTPPSHDGFSQTLRQCLQAYLAGDNTSLDEIPVSLGGTPFQQQVWLGLRSIPFGSVITYSEFAGKLGKPTACRAVGMTNSLNPVAIVLPCHRVIGANGHLTGYAGGLERKRWLLQHEGVDLTPFKQPRSPHQLEILSMNL
ncbi:MAG: methylated-DNA--[protein]-cysteine S-methyltransferase [Leptolyngbyaceae cyanobacterium CRU_2_3]|nr:methylated-DNA--[protein]-cysteine S-methyltransferase [Leptolyngbyaceae cyanobacterium CRU_2_3]